MRSAQQTGSTGTAENAAALAKAFTLLKDQGMPEQALFQINQAMSPLFEPHATSPQEQQDEERTWAKRMHNAYEKLRSWQTRRDFLREEQRKINRRVGDAEKHIDFFQKQVHAATTRDPNWPDYQKYEGIDWARDSKAPSDAGAEEDSTMDADSMSTGNSNIAMPSTPFQHQASAFQTTMPSLFAALGNAGAQLNDPFAAATVQILSECGVTEQDVHARVAQLQTQATSGGPMVAPGVAPDQF